MKKSDSMVIFVIIMALMLAGCGNKTDSLQPETGASTPVVVETPDNQENASVENEVAENRIATIGGPYGEISVNLSEKWTYEEAPVDSNKLMCGLYGLILKPEGVSDGQIELLYIDSFGVCGTGLSEEEITLAGHTVHVGTYDDNEHWDFITFRNDKPQIVAQHTDCSSWTDEMWDEALSILDTVKFDETKTEGGIGQYIPESENDTIAVMMEVNNVTPSGLTVHFRQYDKRDTEELTYGQAYTLQVLNGDKWENVPVIIDNGAFTDEGYILPALGEASMETNWEWLYGKLSPGTYRITKSIVDDRSVGNNPLYFLTSQFIIAEN